MPSIAKPLARLLQREANLQRAVETGTYHGAGARRLAAIFPSVVTIELSPELHAAARERLQDLPHVRAIHGHSVDWLGALADPAVPTLWFLDGHWSGGSTAGQQDECPVLAEIALLGQGHPDDVIVVDDARLFVEAPPPPHDPAQWPSLDEVTDSLRAAKPSHHVALLDDQLVAVPARVRPGLAEYQAKLSARGSGSTPQPC